jgi:hypothetical protein
MKNLDDLEDQIKRELGELEQIQGLIDVMNCKSRKTSQCPKKSHPENLKIQSRSEIQNNDFPKNDNSNSLGLSPENDSRGSSQFLEFPEFTSQERKI